MGSDAPAPIARRGLERAAAPVLYFLLALLLTWPTLPEAAARVPAGTEPAPTVPLLNLWILGWNRAFLVGEAPGYWDAPIFHPVPGAFAFSDPQPLTGALATLLWWASPALAYNVVLWTFLTLDGWLVARLARARGAEPLAALLTGALAEALPFLAHERGVLQLQPFFGIAWALESLGRLAERPRWRDGAGLGLAASTTFLTSEYYALFLVLVLVPGLVLFSRRALRRAAGPLGLAVVLAGGLCGPIALAQVRLLRQMGLERSEASARRFSATARDYLRRSPALRWSAPRAGEADSVEPLWPGFVLLGLAGLGAAVGLAEGPRRRWTLFLLLAAGSCGALSLGPSLVFGGLRPYEMLRAAVPGMENLRSPFRLGLFVQLALALLAGGALDAWVRRGRRLRAGLVALLALVELAPRPTPLVGLPPEADRRDLPGPVALLPYARGRSAAA